MMIILMMIIMTYSIYFVIFYRSQDIVFASNAAVIGLLLALFYSSITVVLSTLGTSQEASAGSHVLNR